MSGGYLGVEAMASEKNGQISQHHNGVLDHLNPLDCLICSREFVHPIRLPCHHVYCRDCVKDIKKCPACDRQIENELEDDTLVEFLIETAHEAAEICANCDQVVQPMHFCETCRQPLCNLCKVNTHQARMFSSHQLIPLEERSRVKGRTQCPVHSEPYILYATDSKKLACISCFKAATVETRHFFVDLDSAHKMGIEKLEKVAGKLRSFQQDIREQIELRRRLLAELHDSHKRESLRIKQTAQTMIDCLVKVRDELSEQLEMDKNCREDHFSGQLKQLSAALPSLDLYLLSSSIFIASASKLDFLTSANDLTKRIQNLIAESSNRVTKKPLFTGQLSSDTREAFARALDPHLGLASILLPPSSAYITTITNNNNNNIKLDNFYNVGESQQKQNMESLGQNDENSADQKTIASSTPPNRRNPRCRSGSGYVNCPPSSLLSKYQLLVDLAGAFGEEFAKIDSPLRNYTTVMARLGRGIQELQRDLTLRQCIIEQDRLTVLIADCVELDKNLGTHSTLVQEIQPQLQLIWQEQLDRVRRQQMLFREKVEQTAHLQEDCRQMTSVIRRLDPYAKRLAGAATLINPKRALGRLPAAPMEIICLQINTLSPDSQHRIEAIEKEESNRRLTMERRKQNEADSLKLLKNSLKVVAIGCGEGSNGRKQRKTRLGSDGRLVKTVGRERSRGGTDRSLMSPQKRRDLLAKNSPALSPKQPHSSMLSQNLINATSISETFELFMPPKDSDALLRICDQITKTTLSENTCLTEREVGTLITPKCSYIVGCRNSMTGSIVDTTLINSQSKYNNNNNNEEKVLSKSLPESSGFLLAENRDSSTNDNTNMMIVEKIAADTSNYGQDRAPIPEVPPIPEDFLARLMATTNDEDEEILAVKTSTTSTCCQQKQHLLDPFEAKERLLDSLKRKVARINVGAVGSPDRDIATD